MATEKQVKCMYALSRSLGKEAKYEELMKLPTDVASKSIDELRKALDNFVKEPDTQAEPFSDVGFGMACKMVENYLISINQFNTVTQQAYNKLVSDVYKRHQEAKRAIKAPLGGVQ